jgi:hypothetical protein
MDPKEQWLNSTLDHIVEEAYATKGTMKLEPAVEILIGDRVERRILSAAEAVTVRAMFARRIREWDMIVNGV